MSIYTRIEGTEAPRIPVHTLCSAVAEYARGQVTGPVASGWFDLSAAEKTELTALLGRVQGGQLTSAEVQDCLILLEAGKRTANATKTRLGV